MKSTATATTSANADRGMELEFPELEFEEKTHTYILNGAVIPSVSSIMEPLSNRKYSGINSRTLDRAAQRGTMVHNAIENYLAFGIEDIEPEFEGFFRGFLDWWDSRNPALVGSEIRVYHKTLLYGGTVDLLAYIGEDLALVDYKTTSVLSEMTCGVQLEAYAQALASHGIRVQKKYILHLKKDGKFAVQEFPTSDASRWRTFGALKCVSDYMRSYEK